MELPFWVVEFIEEGSVDIVPSTWIVQRNEQFKSYWPNSSPRQKAKRLETPDPNWKLFNVRIFKFADSFEKAQKLCTKAVETSNLESDDEVPSRRLRVQSPISFLEVEFDKQKEIPEDKNNEMDDSCASQQKATTQEERLNVKIDLLLEMQKELDKQVRRALVTIPKIDQPLEFDLLEEPMDSMSQLNQLEESIKENKTLRQNMVRFLTGIGGGTLGDTVRRIMKSIGTAGLWSNFSYRGRKGKTALCQYTLCKVILRGCHAQNKANTVMAIEKEVQEFLKHAPYKPGGSCYKKTKSASSSNSSFETETYLSSSSD